MDYNKNIVKWHAKQALKGIHNNVKQYKKAAIFNAYLHLILERTNGATAKTADEVLTERAAVCGGMTMALRALLDSAGIKNEYAFTIGNQAAHSMVEAYFNDGTTGLFDPYHGTMYFDKLLNKPIGIIEVYNRISKKEYPVLYVDRTFDIQTPLKFEKIYLEAPVTKISDYDFPEIFTKTDSYGIANSGFATLINIELTPDSAIGSVNWDKPTDTEPKPWSALSVWQKSPQVNLSWAYLMGRISIGYLVQHIYTLKGLTVGSTYTLELKIANALGFSKDKKMKGPAITLTPISPFGSSKYVPLNVRSYNSKADYSPQIARLRLIASSSEMTIHGYGYGEFVVQSIELRSGN